MNPRSVLVIDDDEDLREAIGSSLEADGYEILYAANGREALDLLGKGMVGLVLLDMRMPVMNGWEFARLFHERHDHLAPIVVVTAATDAGRCADEIGADGFVTKPFDLTTLINKVRQFLPGVTR